MASRIGGIASAGSRTAKKAVRVQARAAKKVARVQKRAAKATVRAGVSAAKKGAGIMSLGLLGKRDTRVKATAERKAARSRGAQARKAGRATGTAAGRKAGRAKAKTFMAAAPSRKSTRLARKAARTNPPPKAPSSSKRTKK
jgi:hypothetical protein